MLYFYGIFEIKESTVEIGLFIFITCFLLQIHKFIYPFETDIENNIFIDFIFL